MQPREGDAVLRLASSRSCKSVNKNVLHRNVEAIYGHFSAVHVSTTLEASTGQSLYALYVTAIVPVLKCMNVSRSMRFVVALE